MERRCGECWRLLVSNLEKGRYNLLPYAGGYAHFLVSNLINFSSFLFSLQQQSTATMPKIAKKDEEWEKDLDDFAKSGNENMGNGRGPKKNHKFHSAYRLILDCRRHGRNTSVSSITNFMINGISTPLGVCTCGRHDNTKSKEVKSTKSPCGKIPNNIQNFPAINPLSTTTKAVFNPDAKNNNNSVDNTQKLAGITPLLHKQKDVYNPYARRKKKRWIELSQKVRITSRPPRESGLSLLQELPDHRRRRKATRLLQFRRRLQRDHDRRRRATCLLMFRRFLRRDHHRRRRAATCLF